MFKDIKWVELGCLSTPAVGIRNHRDLKLNGLMENMFWVVSRLVGNSKVISVNLTAFVDHDQPMALCSRSQGTWVAARNSASDSCS
jgi:hypothetical protein